MTDELTDAGAPAERTSLAWQRTGLAATTVGALLVRLHPVTPWPGVLLMTVGALLAAAVAPLRYARIRRAVHAGSTPLARHAVVGLVAAVLVVIAGAATMVAR